MKGYGFAKDKSKYNDKNISKRLSGKYNPGMLAARQKRFDHAKQSPTGALKNTSKRAI